MTRHTTIDPRPFSSGTPHVAWTPRRAWLFSLGDMLKAAIVGAPVIILAFAWWAHRS